MRRLFVLAAVLATTLAGIAQAETLRIVMHSDLKALDPIWSGTYISRNHGYLIYDTLFAMDEKFQPRPQMVERWSVSDDGLTWTFSLRGGLEWHDGTPVTAEDCTASLKRWSASTHGEEAGAAVASTGWSTPAPSRSCSREVRADARDPGQAVGRRAVHDAQARRR